MIVNSKFNYDGSSLLLMLLFGQYPPTTGNGKREIDKLEKAAKKSVTNFRLEKFANLKFIRIIKAF